MTTLHKSLALLLIIASTPVHSLETDVEHQQKTRLVRYIINKVSWPNGSIPKNSFTICTLSEPENIKIVEKLNGQTIQKRTVRVKPLLPKDSASSCQLIYIAKQSIENQKKIITKYGKRPVLLLGDMEHFASIGGSMNFAVLQNSVALTLNLESLKRSKLKMASKELDNVIVVPEEKDLN